MTENPADQAMVTAIHQVGYVLGIKTVAEFVENDATIQSLKTIGIDYIQGYAVGKPRPIEQVQALLQNSRSAA